MKRMNKKPCTLGRILATMFVVAGGLATTPACGDTVILHPRAWVDHDATEVRVADVAALEGAAAEQAADVLVLRMEPTAQRTVLTLEQVRRALNNADVNWGVVSLSGSSCTVMRLGLPEPMSAAGGEATAPAAAEPEMALPRASQYLRDATLQGAVARFVVERMGVPSERLELLFDPADAKVLATSGRGIRFEVLTSATESSARLPLSVTVFREERPVATHRVTVDVRVETEVRICARYLARGERLAEGDVEVKTLLIEPHPSRPLGNDDAIVGTEATRRLVVGQILRHGDVEPPLVVKRRSRVTVRAVRGRFVLRLTAVALEDGRVGEVIRVRHLTNDAEFHATVDADGQLTVLQPEAISLAINGR